MFYIHAQQLQIIRKRRFKTEYIACHTVVHDIQLLKEVDNYPFTSSDEVPCVQRSL